MNSFDGKLAAWFQQTIAVGTRKLRSILMARKTQMFQVPPELKDIVESTPDTLHGAVRFKGTRVFAQQLFDYLFAGDSVNDFLQDFPEIPRNSAEALLEWERRRLQKELNPRLSA